MAVTTSGLDKENGPLRTAASPGVFTNTGVMRFRGWTLNYNLVFLNEKTKKRQQDVCIC